MKHKTLQYLNDCVASPALTKRISMMVMEEGHDPDTKVSSMLWRTKRSISADMKGLIPLLRSPMLRCTHRRQSARDSLKDGWIPFALWNPRAGKLADCYTMGAAWY